MQNQSVLDFGLDATAGLLASAFADYFVSLPHSAATLLAMVRQDSVELTASRIWWCDDQPAAVLLHAARGASARLAGMGVVPAARRRGVGRHAVERWIADCRTQGFRWLTLEVIGANAPAIALYERCGFQRVQRLAGWTWPATTAVSADFGTPQRIDVRRLAQRIAAQSDALALPWQISAESVAQLAPPWSAWELDGAAVAISDLAAPVVAVRGVTWPDSAGRAAVPRLLRALVAAHPGHDWRASAIYPESWGEQFQEAGWSPSVLDQWQMTLALD